MPIPIACTSLRRRKISLLNLPENITKCVVMFSGGAGSWAAAKRCVDRFGAENVTLAFADTKMEDEDLYRFLHEAAANTGAKLEILSDGRDVWEVFKDVKFLGNSRVDPCSLLLKRDLLNKWLKDNFDPSETCVALGIDWTESGRFRKALPHWKRFTLVAPLIDRPFLEKCDVLKALEAEGIRPPRLYELGFPHNNCFQGDTKFITSEGIKTLRECEGQEVEVLGLNGGWKKATIQTFGIQRFHSLILRRGTEAKTIRVTADHRWFVRVGRDKRKEVLTHELTPGDKLVGMYGGRRSGVRPSAFAIAQGIVFGDGCSPKTTNGPAKLVLCGEKDAPLLQYFPLSPNAEVCAGVEVRDLPRTWKNTPDIKESQSFLLGWLMGYFAADGTVSSGQVKLSSSSYSNLEFVKSVCAKIGIGAGRISTEMRIGFGVEPSPLHTLVFTASTLSADFFLIDAHRVAFEKTPHRRPNDWEVVEVEEYDYAAEAYCAVVPDGHAFTLEDNILTGNCGGFCVKAGISHFVHLLEVMPERYAYHEAKEQELREHIGKDVAILTDRRNKQKIPMTLKTLRERYEAGEKLPRFEWGGCACFSGDVMKESETEEEIPLAA